MRISDWSSDVCSSDLLAEGPGPVTPRARARVRKLRSSADEAPNILLRSVRVMDVAVAVDTFKRFGLGEMMFAHITRNHAPRPFRSDNVEAKRSEERRVGKEGVCTCRSWWSPRRSKNKQN